jgi:hypothetical protein
MKIPKLRTTSEWLCPQTGIWSPQNFPHVTCIVIEGDSFPLAFGSTEWAMMNEFE